MFPVAAICPSTAAIVAEPGDRSRRHEITPPHGTVASLHVQIQCFKPQILEEALHVEAGDG